MPEYRIVRTFGENKRGSKIELTAKDAAALLDGPRPFIEASGGTAAKPRKRAAKKTIAPAAESPAS